VLGLVRGLVEWVPTSAAWAGYVAGPLVLLGYLAGSIPLGDVVATRRFRRQLERDRFPVARFADVDPATLMTGALAAAVTLVAATVAWDVGLEAAPRGQFSAIGTYANQALGAWVSLALWTGTAAMIGSMAPVWTRFRRGGSGVAPALVLLVVYTPLLAATGLAAGSLGYALTQRWRVALGAGLAAIVVTEWVAWVTDLQTAWGITNGPELGLWSAILAIVLLGRTAVR
jgi:glycerol-3-phosphate acyltransferase PlsY